LTYGILRLIFSFSAAFCALCALLMGLLCTIFFPYASKLLETLHRFSSLFRQFLPDETFSFPLPDFPSWLLRTAAPFLSFFVVVAVCILYRRKVVRSLDRGKAKRYSSDEQKVATDVREFLSDLRPFDLPSWFPPARVTWRQRIDHWWQRFKHWCQRFKNWLQRIRQFLGFGGH
jgi:hypothetical protein